MSASVVHLSRKNPMGGVCGGGKIIPRFPQLWGVWGRGAVFESCLHLGAHKTLAALQQRAWWASMQQDVRKYVAGCSVYQRIKDVNKGPAGLL